MTDPRLAALHAKYPKAYPLPDWKRSPWAFDRFGFECGPGWADILDKLGPVLELHSVHVHQVKEKFGGLRVYYDGVIPDVDAAIKAAEAEAWRTCELCGDPGKCESRGNWLSTRCPVCRKADEDHAAAWNDAQRGKP